MFVSRFAHAAGWLTALALGCLPMLAAAQSDFQGTTDVVPFEEDTISYNKTPSTRAIARLQSRLDRGEVKLKFDPQSGWRDGYNPRQKTQQRDGLFDKIHRA